MCRQPSWRSSWRRWVESGQRVGWRVRLDAYRIRRLSDTAPYAPSAPQGSFPQPCAVLSHADFRVATKLTACAVLPCCCCWLATQEPRVLSFGAATLRAKFQFLAGRYGRFQVS